MFFLKRSLSTKILILSSLFLLLISTKTVANSNEPNRIFNPPPPKRVKRIKQNRTIGSGSRSKCNNPLKNKSMTMFVPEMNIVHYTTSSNPSFYLDIKEIPSKNTQFLFKLVSPDPLANNPIVEETFFIEETGIKELKLPPQVELEIGKVYLWLIVVPCANNPEEVAQVLRAAVERLPISWQLSNQLQVADSPENQAQIYAKEGIWYDTLSFSLQESQYSTESINYVKQLGQEVGINLETADFSTFKANN